VLTLGEGVAVLGNSLKSGVVAWLWENPPFVRYAATLVVRGNISLTINIALSDTVTLYEHCLILGQRVHLNYV
jgi:hypothetical protein